MKQQVLVYIDSLFTLKEIYIHYPDIHQLQWQPLEILMLQ